MDLASLPTTVTVRKFCERTDGNIHTDHKSKVITVLVYFNENWEHEDGQLRMLRSKVISRITWPRYHHWAAHCWPFAAPTTPGTAIPSFVGERRMVQLNYLDQSPLAVAAQRISRFGTHFMKNVLGCARRLPARATSEFRTALRYALPPAPTSSGSSTSAFAERLTRPDSQPLLHQHAVKSAKVPGGTQHLNTSR